MTFNDKRVLKLTLKSDWFWLMLDGRKRLEFRKASKWIESRLIDKKGDWREYDVVQFTNGYGNDKPVFWVVFLGVELVGYDEGEFIFTDREGNDKSVLVNSDDYLITLGSIIHHRNCYPKLI